MAQSEEHPVASELIIDVVALLRRSGNRCEVPVHTQLDGIATSLAHARSLDGVLVAESMADKLTIDGELKLAWSGGCRRCMEPAEGIVKLEVREVFETEPEEGETYQLGTDSLDLMPMLEESVLLALPLAPLCGDSCQGPAPQTYPAEVVRDSSDRAERDPRWAALDDLVFGDEPAD